MNYSIYTLIGLNEDGCLPYLIIGQYEGGHDKCNAIVRDLARYAKCVRAIWRHVFYMALLDVILLLTPAGINAWNYGIFAVMMVLVACIIYNASEIRKLKPLLLKFCADYEVLYNLKAFAYKSFDMTFKEGQEAARNTLVEAAYQMIHAQERQKLARAKRDDTSTEIWRKVHSGATDSFYEYIGAFSRFRFVDYDINLYINAAKQKVEQMELQPSSK